MSIFDVQTSQSHLNKLMHNAQFRPARGLPGNKTSTQISIERKEKVVAKAISAFNGEWNNGIWNPAISAYDNLPQHKNKRFNR